MVEQVSGQFKAKKGAGWDTIRDAEPAYVRTPSPQPLDEDPYILSTTEDTQPPPPPVAKGGLQSASALRAEQDRRAAEQDAKKKQNERELAQLRKARRDRGEESEDEHDPTATVYRDASGKRIDMKLAKAEEAKQRRDELEREMKKMEWGKGLVQKGEKAQRQREAQALAAKPLARYADDADMNDELKDQDRWNDPAAAFLTVSWHPLLVGRTSHMDTDRIACTCT